MLSLLDRKALWFGKLIFLGRVSSKETKWSDRSLLNFMLFFSIKRSRKGGVLIFSLCRCHSFF